MAYLRKNKSDTVGVVLKDDEAVLFTGGFRFVYQGGFATPEAVIKKYNSDVDLIDRALEEAIAEGALSD